MGGTNTKHSVLRVVTREDWVSLGPTIKLKPTFFFRKWKKIEISSACHIIPSNIPPVPASTAQRETALTQKMEPRIGEPIQILEPLYSQIFECCSSSLMELSLTRELIEMKVIISLLENATKLSILKLHSGFFSDKDMKALAAVVADNRTLSSLYIAGDSISLEGAEAFAEMLQKNTTLTTLSLYGTRCGAQHAVILSKGLRQNRRLTSLDLGGNLIFDAKRSILTEFYDNMINNLTVKNLNLVGSGIGSMEMTKKLKASLAFNQEVWKKFRVLILARLKDQKSWISMLHFDILLYLIFLSKLLFLKAEFPEAIRVSLSSSSASEEDPNEYW